MGLCSTCEAFDIQSFRRTRFATLGFGLAAVQHSAQYIGCSFCRLLYDALEKERRALDEISPAILKEKSLLEPWIHMQMSEDDRWNVGRGYVPEGGLQFNRMDCFIAPRHYQHQRTPTGQRYNGIDVNLPRTFFRVLADPGSQAARNGDIKGTYLGDDPRSTYHFDAISRWLDNCQRHPACNRSVSGAIEIPNDLRTVLPTRVLSVQGDALRLQDTLDQKAAYVTLSHRWSSQTQDVITTVDNIHERKCVISLETLPQTFRDAIFVTQQLGIPYIWIDSLCIIQAGDDGEDWKTEALKMGQYYQNARLTISAACNGPEGFLKPRTPLNTPLVRLPYRDRSSSHRGSFFVQQRLLAPDRDYHISVRQNSDLLSRGWAFQEWILSRRILFYTPGQVYFECQSEDLYNECRENAQAHDEYALFKKRICTRDSDGRELWYSIIEQYSALELTEFVSDRLVAIAGVAKEIGVMMQSSVANAHGPAVHHLTYVSGLWLHDIHNGLLWEPREPIWPIPRLERKSIPTWSWAFWPGGVHWRSRDTSSKTALHIERILSSGDYRTSEEEQQTDLVLDDTFCCLEMCGKLSFVLLCASVNKYSNDERARLAKYTGVSEDRTDRWCAIARPDAPQSLIGWADMDRDFVPFLQMDLVSERAIIQVIHVSTREDVPHGIAFGLRGNTHEVYSFLAVIPMLSDSRRPGRYERIGVGRIFEQDYFKGSEETRFELA